MSRVGCVGRPCTYVRVTVRRDYIISREDEHAAAPMMGDPYMPGFSAIMIGRDLDGLGGLGERTWKPGAAAARRATRTRTAPAAPTWPRPRSPREDLPGRGQGLHPPLGGDSSDGNGDCRLFVLSMIVCCWCGAEAMRLLTESSTSYS